MSCSGRIYLVIKSHPRDSRLSTPPDGVPFTGFPVILVEDLPTVGTSPAAVSCPRAANDSEKQKQHNRAPFV